MYGETMGSLKVSSGIFNDAGNMVESSLFFEEGNQGDVWQHSMVQLLPGNDFVLLFDATSGGHFRSDVSIDDIVIFEEACDMVQERTLTVRFEIMTLLSPKKSIATQNQKQRFRYGPKIQIGVNEFTLELIFSTI